MNKPSSHARLIQVLDHVGTVFLGKRELTTFTLACLLARGHLLLEDVPGVGKTTLALALARSLGLEFRRVQFTSDLLPADILGVTVFSQTTSEFSFRPGPIFSNVVLADEINRTTPRTQSALLEAMSERRVTVDNETHNLPLPFLVIATQNPLELYGTYPLPESQLDRFLMRLSVGNPGREVELNLLKSRGSAAPVDSLKPLLSPEEFEGLQEEVEGVHLSDDVASYILDVVEATRRDARIKIGVSTRGALALTHACRAWAFLDGRSFVVPDDARRLIVPCLAHRLSITGSASAEKSHAENIMEDIASKVSIPS